MNGTCRDFCPSKERQERLHFNTVATVELYHKERSNWKQKSLLIKKFQRSAAGLVSHHSEVRSPAVLLQTVQYLCSHVLDLDRLQTEDPRWRDDPRKRNSIPIFAGDLELFLRDRLRMVAKDLALQGYSADGQRTHPDAICCLEAIVRFHLVSAHECCQAEPSDFDPHMNWSSLSGYVASLDHLYKLTHQQQPRAVAKVWCRCEPTMRAYMLLAMLPTPRHMWRNTLQTLNNDNIYASKRIQTTLIEIIEQSASQIITKGPLFVAALEVCQACLSGDYGTFFNIAKKCTDVIFLCGMHAQFDRVRLQALKTINQVYRSTFRLDTILSELCCNDINHVETLCREFGFQIQPSGPSGPSKTSETTSGTSSIILNHKLKLPLIANKTKQIDCSICRKSQLIIDLFNHQTRGSAVLKPYDRLLKSNVSVRISETKEEETKHHSSGRDGGSKRNTQGNTQGNNKGNNNNNSNNNNNNNNYKTKSHSNISISNETVVSSIDQLGRRIVIEVRNIDHPPCRAFVFKDDTTKSRSKKKTKVRQVFICRLSLEDGLLYNASNNKQSVLAIENKCMVLYHSLMINREHRLALSVLQASGVGNAAVAILCDKTRAIQLCSSFRKRETESVIGLLAVPLYNATEGSSLNNFETKGQATTSSSSRSSSLEFRNKAAGFIDQQRVIDAWTQNPLVHKDFTNTNVELHFGHHLMHMLTFLSSAVCTLQKEGKMNQSIKGMHLILIAQHQSIRKKKDKVKLDCPGGKRHFGESAEACAIREVNEEVGFEMLLPNQKFDYKLALDETMCGFLALL